MFTWVLQQLADADLVRGRTVGIDATTLEANAALRSIVRRETGEDYTAFLTQLAEASGIATPTRAELARFDRPRKKKTSNADWTHPHYPDARVTRMKDGRTHLAHKAEHAVGPGERRDPAGGRHGRHGIDGRDTDRGGRAGRDGAVGVEAVQGLVEPSGVGARRLRWRARRGTPQPPPSGEPGALPAAYSRDLKNKPTGDLRTSRYCSIRARIVVGKSLSLGTSNSWFPANAARP